MLILALDTCDARGSIALVRDDKVLGVTVHEGTEDYSSWLLPAVQNVLRGAETPLAEVDSYAVASGPGSFTGLRVGLTTVKAWTEVYSRPIAPVSRLDALATQTTTRAAYMAAFIDAHRGQVFGAIYGRKDSRFQRLEDEAVSAPEAFVTAAIQRAAGRRIQWISLDPQCIAHTEAWASRRDLGETIEVIPPILAPAIARLGHELLASGQSSNALTLDANYVRRSDAEIFWRAAPSHAK
jgi:tRNA threonylcarbamoyladenosine biosynthesis protein TsaB